MPVQTDLLQGIFDPTGDLWGKIANLSVIRGSIDEHTARQTNKRCLNSCLGEMTGLICSALKQTADEYNGRKSLISVEAPACSLMLVPLLASLVLNLKTKWVF